ncbi:MAG: S4 domain-containing protein [Candidatus Paceibacterota bacterium]|jgi:23S rRNA pseudouridine2604 synthase
MKEKNNFPIRINKYLANKGYSSRRGADGLIEKKLVTINGRIAILGDIVKEKDIVEIKTKNAPKILYAIYYKSAGEVKETILINGVTLYAVDQLEKEIPGIVLFTNDRRVASRINDRKYIHEREYVIHMRDKIRENFKEKILNGVYIDGKKELVAAKGAEVIDEKICAIVLTENAQHLVRRIAVALFNEAREIERVRIANITNEGIKNGNSRELSVLEQKELLSSLSLESI